ncbi:hypothetical protein P7C73_g6740, partial [Tremellales sp. Uapishka_1]
MSQANPLSTWYNNAYSGPFSRTSRLRAPSLIPSARLVPTQSVTQQTLVVDAAAGRTGADTKDEGKIKRRETIFGPDVGEDEEKGWTEDGVEGGETKIGVETVKKWVERAKNEEGLHATTTLQAMVNLKRPTLLLHPLDGSPLHTLKFNYDATTPNVSITLSVHPTPAAGSTASEPARILYNGIHTGGFNREFTLPSDTALDLSPAIATPSSAELVMPPPGPAPTEDAARESQSEDTSRSAAAPPLENAAADDTNSTAPRRFGLFRREREPDVEAGPIEMTNRNGDAEVAKEESIEVEQGMRVLIRIEAVGREGEVLSKRNAQLTHILINGMWVPEAGATLPAQTGKRVWVIKVVRREAIIGAHTFLLKEIYGLSSSTTTTAAQPTYPPTENPDPYASTPNECIVCLTSPRDVVLLPCRHLVVCRECAVGMVEFGAGGKVGRREETAAAPAPEEDAAGGATAAGAAAGTAVPALAATTTGRERRKKKAKGWFCPVCRQPYTSLLRLALPTSTKDVPLSRAPSIRSVRTMHSTAPTLPDGAERMLESLHVSHYNAEDDDVVEVEEVRGARPQFVLGPDVDDEKNVEEVGGHRA